MVSVDEHGGIEIVAPKHQADCLWEQVRKFFYDPHYYNHPTTGIMSGCLSIPASTDEISYFESIKTRRYKPYIVEDSFNAIPICVESCWIETENFVLWRCGNENTERRELSPTCFKSSAKLIDKICSASAALYGITTYRSEPGEAFYPRRKCLSAFKCPYGSLELYLKALHDYIVQT